MTWNVFYSYAHEDAELRKQLATHLAPLKHQAKIKEWCDRDIRAGDDWNKAIESELDEADLILLLLSPDFLASEYCFGVEIARAMARVKEGSAVVMPIILRQCMWEDSVFSALQIIPRDARPVASSTAADEAWKAIALEVRQITSNPPPRAAKQAPSSDGIVPTAPPNAVTEQVRRYARLYERIRQRMKPSSERTTRMEEVFSRMLDLAPSYVTMLGELVASPSPGERLAALAILRRIALEEYLPFLAATVRNEKPFAGYHAALALEFAVGALEPASYPKLKEAIGEAQRVLEDARVRADSDRGRIVRRAATLLQEMTRILADPTLPR